MLLNRSPATALVTCSWDELGLPHPSGPASVRDLWERQDLGNFTAAYSVYVPSHGAVVIRAVQ